jgi:hypothetical protein
MLPDNIKNDPNSPFPCLNNNGDTAETLLKCRIKLYSALMDLGPLLAECAPHMRNYHCMSDSASRYRSARSNSNQRYGAIDSIKREILEDVEAIQAQIKEDRT